MCPITKLLRIDRSEVLFKLCNNQQQQAVVFLRAIHYQRNFEFDIPLKLCSNLPLYIRSLS